MFLKDYQLSSLKQDLPAGLVAALVTVPIAMGYAEVAGLPAVYGLYGSVVPVLIFVLLSSSPRVLLGVDAQPAAMTGILLLSMGVTLESREAMALVPAVTMVTALILLIFSLARAGRAVKFVSAPVMAGFGSGVCVEIILMQVPRLFGGRPGVGEGPELVHHIWKELMTSFNDVSLLLGVGTVLIILICQFVAPRLPAAVLLMVAGILMTRVIGVQEMGVQVLPRVSPGFPAPSMPDLSVLSGSLEEILTTSFSIALVITAESLLTTGTFAFKYGEKVDNNRELLAYGLANMGAALFGSPALIVSVSRTNMLDRVGTKSQMTSFISGLTMLLILLFGTGHIHWLPVPVLTGIVIAALISSTEFDLAVKLKRMDKVEFWIFWVVFATVLFFGAVRAVAVGLTLSFATYIIRSSNPPKAFLGVLPGQYGFHSIGKEKGVLPIRGVVIYRFSSALFFANCEQFQRDIEEAIQPDTKAVIIEASGIGSIDVTAAERLEGLYHSLKKRGVRLFVTGHRKAVNDQLRTFGCEEIFRDGGIYRTVTAALARLGMEPPYPTAAPEEGARRGNRLINDYEWAYGDEAGDKLMALARRLTEETRDGKPLTLEAMQKAEKETFGSEWAVMDEESVLDLLEMQLAVMAEKGEITQDRLAGLEQCLADAHARLDVQQARLGQELLFSALMMRREREADFQASHPEAWAMLQGEREKHRELLYRDHPEVLALIDRLDKERRT